jgi:hypothetical protein
MIRLVREIVYDPIPTPAGRSGRVAVFAGFAGWALLAVAGTLWITSMTLGLDESGLATSLRVAAGWIAGGCVVIYLTGMLFSASGATLLVHGVPDSGLRAVTLGFALNGLPMVLIGVAAAYDKFLRPLLADAV